MMSESDSVDFVQCEISITSSGDSVDDDSEEENDGADDSINNPPTLVGNPHSLIQSLISAITTGCKCCSLKDANVMTNDDDSHSHMSARAGGDEGENYGDSSEEVSVLYCFYPIILYYILIFLLTYVVCYY